MSEAHFKERLVQVDLPTHHYALITAPDGRFLAMVNDELIVTTVTDDAAIWDWRNNELVNVTTGKTLSTSMIDSGVHLTFDGQPVNKIGEIGTPATFTIGHGPEKMPSEYLEFFQAHGWVCLTSILPPDVLEELERVSYTDRYQDRKFDTSAPPFNQSPAMAKTAAEPVSLWLMRRYMQTDEIRLGHTPSLAIVGKDDGKRNVQGWHSDFPYLWGISGSVNEGRETIPDGRVPTPSGPTVLGVQRNVCISPFTGVGGATAFKLGSRDKDRGPPRDWGTGTSHGRPGYRAEHGLPYTGENADIVEAPGGSIILYDSRTWHRAGINRTEKRRSAMLQAMIPMYIMPFYDLSASYKSFLKSDAYQALNERERDEMRRLMVHYMAGPGGLQAITVDQELTEHVKDSGARWGAYS